jgi:hypothetical protein
VEEEGKTEKLFPYNVIGKECRHCHCFFNSLSQTKKVFSSRKKEVSLWVLGKLKVIWTRCLCSHRRHWRRKGMKTKRTKKAIGEGWKRIAEVGDKSFSKLKGIEGFYYSSTRMSSNSKKYFCITLCFSLFLYQSASEL